MTISSLIPDDLKKLLIEIEDLGFILCLVGGAPRDFLLYKTLSPDLDFEVRNLEIKFLKDFLKKKSISFAELPYEILRVDYYGYDLEFSPPRLERPILDNKTHHHFEAVLDKNLSYKDGFKRRDFTINAMGYELSLKKSSEKFIDPYDGKKDLENKKLKAVSEDFFLDSVRFLRLIRFMVKYNLTVDASLLKDIPRFDLSALSKHHFLSEMMKSKNAASFLNQFTGFVKKYQLKVPGDFEFLMPLQFLALERTEDLLAQAHLQGKGSEMAKLLSLPEKKLKDLESFRASYDFVKNLSSQNLVEQASLPLNEESDLDVLKHIKNLEDKKEWKKYFLDPLPISWDDWQKIEIDPQTINQAPAKVRSYLKYQEALKAKYKK